MSLLKWLVSRGNSVMREWNSYDGIDENSERMITEVAAATLYNLCGDKAILCSEEEKRAKVNALKIALRSSFQIGRNTPAISMFEKRGRA